MWYFSINEIWFNGTRFPPIRTNVSPHGIVNITVWAYNTSENGTLSNGNLSDSVQVPNNPVQLTNTSDWSDYTGETVTVDLDYIDLDNDSVVFTCNRTDLFTNFDSANGTGSFQATVVETWYVNFGISDGWGSPDNYTMTIESKEFTSNGYGGSGWIPPSREDGMGNYSPMLFNRIPTGPLIQTYVGVEITFSATSNQTSNNSWYFNNTEVEWDNGTMYPSFTVQPSVGICNITLRAHNSSNLTLYEWNTWTWHVFEIPPPGQVALKNVKENILRGYSLGSLIGIILASGVLVTIIGGVLIGFSGGTPVLAEALMNPEVITKVVGAILVVGVLLGIFALIIVSL